MYHDSKLLVSSMHFLLLSPLAVELGTALGLFLRWKCTFVASLPDFLYGAEVTINIVIVELNTDI